MKKIKLSKISALHYFKLCFRSLLLIATLAVYIYVRVTDTATSFVNLDSTPVFVVLCIVWGIFVVEMLLRFFPSSLESMGCQKQFKKNYVPTGDPVPTKPHPWYITFIIAVLWLALNAIFGILYYTHVIDATVLLIISLAFSVCDMICILFFCPFQTWFMKNKCCGSCRIYNWDFAMMFTPLVFIPSFFTWSLLGMALLLLLFWEIYVHARPKHFSENTNACLSCNMCNEKLCHHKKQLRSFIKKQKIMQRLKAAREALLAPIEDDSENEKDSVEQETKIEK